MNKNAYFSDMCNLKEDHEKIDNLYCHSSDERNQVVCFKLASKKLSQLLQLEILEN